MDILKSHILFFFISFFIVFLAGYLSRKNKISGVIDTKEFIIFYAICVGFSLFSSLISSYYISKYFPVFFSKKPIGDQLYLFGIVCNITKIIESLFLVMPLSILILSPVKRNFIGLKSIHLSIEKCLAASLSVFLLLSTVSYFFTNFNVPISPSSPSNASSSIEPYMLFATGNIYIYILLCLILSISNEIFFRGFVYTVLKQRMKILIAIIIESFLASSFTNDFNSQLSLLMFIESILFTLLYQITESVYPCIIIHFIFLVLPVLHGI